MQMLDEPKQKPRTKQALIVKRETMKTIET